ncbi:hypothetical protein [Streptomyces sp. NPDC006355]|uniref:hypothetical protein n=1 Tax=Streptomyces sp. NPDC006355 TaxID=3156758 RepID=UPI0033AA4FCA
MTDPIAPQPDFTSPIAGRIEVREPCPWCPDRPMVPSTLMDDHVARLHPEVQTATAAPAVQAPAADRTTTSRRAGLRDELAAALEAAPYRPETRCSLQLADAIMTVLYREWPWLRAEAEDTAPAEPAADRAAGATAVAASLGRANETAPCVAANRAALRDRIAEALIAWTYRGKDPEHGGILETVRANAYSRADAVLAVLPAPTNRAAVYAEVAELVRSMAPEHPRNAAWVQDCHHIADRIDETRPLLRRMADEAQPAEAGIVAYRSKGDRILRCLSHVPPESEGDFDPVTSDDLPDGGICTHPACGVDVLIPQPSAEARQPKEA